MTKADAYTTTLSPLHIDIHALDELDLSHENDSLTTVSVDSTTPLSPPLSPPPAPTIPVNASKQNQPKKQRYQFSGFLVLVVMGIAFLLL